MSPNAYVVLSAILFSIGLLGFLIRRNVLIAFMSVELMLNSANLAMVAFSYANGTLLGQVGAFFVMVVAAGEVVIGFVFCEGSRSRTEINILVDGEICSRIDMVLV